MFVVFLIVFIVAALGFVAWRIAMRSSPAAPRYDDAYICPHCNAYHCECQKKE